MRQWKIEEYGEAKCAACSVDIEEGERRVVVTYGSRKLMCRNCGKKHLTEKLGLITRTMTELDEEDPVFDRYGGYARDGGATLCWYDTNGNTHKIAEVSDTHLVVILQTVGSPLEAQKGKPLIEYRAEEEKEID